LGKCNKYEQLEEQLAGAGTKTAALGFGGYTTTDSVANTEEFTSSINVTTPAAWASGGNLGTARYLLAGCWNYKQQDLHLVEYKQQLYNSDTEEYDGSAWTGGGI
jgi:hypothetical protein